MSTPGWCSLRFRFDDRELTLLRGAEHIRGAAMAHAPRPEQLRTALKLAKAGHKLGVAHAGVSVTLEESELQLLLEAVRYATDEIHGAARVANDATADSRRRDVVLGAFPELADRGGWRSFGVTRELDSLAGRLHTALHS